MGNKVAKVSKLLANEDAIILDVRTRQEFCSGHLCGAINVVTSLPPLSKQDVQILRDKLLSYPRNKTIIVYCKKGIRSGTAYNILKNVGYSVIDLGGVLTPPLKDIMSGELVVPSMRKCLCSI